MASEVDSLIDIYDHEILAIEKVLKALGETQGKARDPFGYHREIVERFEEIGFTVWADWVTSPDGVHIFKVTIRDRCTPLPHGFDHEQQRWEVQQDILEIDTPGAVHRDGHIITPAKSTSFSTPKNN